MSKLNFLVAEDDQMDVFLLRWALNKAAIDADVTFVNDGVETVDYLENASQRSEQRPDLLLLDLKMPRKNGFEVLRWLQSHPDKRPPRVVVYSSSSVALDIQLAGKLGVDYYMVKPDSALELVGVLKCLESYCPERIVAPPRAEGDGALETSPPLSLTA